MSSRASPASRSGGIALAQEQVNKQTESDLRRAELLAFPLLFLLSLLFFRSLVASLLPLLVGGLAIVGTFLILRIASEVGSISIFALNLTTGLGLGLAIDYSLFIVSRYREELAGVRARARRRCGATMSTAGRTVLFSSLTVAAALASLIVFPQRFLYSMGIGGSLVALFAAGVALVVLPAILAPRPRVNSLAPRFLQRRAERDATATQQGFWYRLSRFVMRRPIRIATLSAAFLIALGIPFFSLKFTSVDAQVLPESASARQVDDVMRARLPAVPRQPDSAAVEGATPTAVSQSSPRSRRDGHRSGAAAANARGRRHVIGRHLERAFISAQSRDTVSAIRDLPTAAGATVLVTGSAAHFVDFQRAWSTTRRSRSRSWWSRRW